MGKLVVESIGIADILERLRTNTWLIPSFQRDFVWSEADVTGLVLSVIEARPIGMATLWEQPEIGDLTLVPASIDDTKDGTSTQTTLAVDVNYRPRKYYAVLDGRQRSTALAMAFGGLRASDSRRKFSGRYFLDVKQREVSERVRYIRESEVRSRGYDKLSVCIADGLFPLATDPEKGLLGQWMGYLQAITDRKNYPDGILPEADELDARNEILKKAFSGITETVLAVYIVPSDYNLGDICEIFETLNTTGTKVSTVDLLHSWLYNDTHNAGQAILLREWIEDLGDQEGAAGWASKSRRPEIVAQAVTACYVVNDDLNKPKPRAVGSSKGAKSISTLKAGDLLATPTEFWQKIIDEPVKFAGYIGDFQKCVAKSFFPLVECPYPVTMAMYVALKWFMENDTRYASQWSEQELDALFRAFFWRNSLTGRYDQGFLSQSATDLRDLKEILFSRSKSKSANNWATEANQFLLNDMKLALPNRDEIYSQLLHTKPAGALGRALSLPVRTRPQVDLLDSATDINYPSDIPVELHHIYPRAWCTSNKHGKLSEVLDSNRAKYDYVKSVSNLTPLSRESNNTWKANIPGQALLEAGLSYQVAGERFEGHFISKNAYEQLVAAEPRPLEFWEIRAQEITSELLKNCSVSL